jgi:hypothetical protein
VQQLKTLQEDRRPSPEAVQAERDLEDATRLAEWILQRYPEYQREED